MLNDDDSKQTEYTICDETILHESIKSPFPNDKPNTMNMYYSVQKEKGDEN
jgi:hypothetical protein